MPNLTPAINFGRCSKKVIDVFLESVKYAHRNRYEFLTPELLLYFIVSQTEFKEFCKEYRINRIALKYELKQYIELQERFPEGTTPHSMMSAELSRLLLILNMISKEFAMNLGLLQEDAGDGAEDDENHRIYEDVVDIPVVLREMYSLDEECMARVLLEKYLGDSPFGWFTELLDYYKDERPGDPESKTGLPPFIKAEAIINGKPVDISNLGNDEVFKNMMKQANRLFHTLGTASHAAKAAENDEDAIGHHEEWEDLVIRLNQTYQKKNPLIGRERELSRCIRILCRKDKNNPLFIGEPGVGKTALIYGLTRMIEENRVPEWLRGHTVYALDMASMVAGASFHGEFEKRMKSVLEGARARGNCILYIDEIHSICDTGGGANSINAAELLKPYLEDGSIRFIGSTTYQDYHKSMAGKKAIARRFGLIDVKEPSVEETIAILDGLLPGYEQHHGVRYDKEAVRYAVEQSAALIHDRFMPDKAIDIIDEAGAWLQQNPWLNKNGQPKAARYQKVNKEIVKTILTDVCRIDAKSLTSESNADLRTLAARIGSEIFGQEKAIDSVVRAVMMAKAGLKEPGKPMASLLFVGPTGVGKTEVCKVLARELGVTFQRFDMSEYTEKHTISKLIGSPAGYIGYDEGGLLTDAVRKTPSCVLLLDEIEKAHSDIYNILLQVMDYACLTDNKGNKADFRNVILVMTSNAGAQYSSQAAIGFAGGLSKGQAMLDTVKKTFKPEFLNRLTDTVVFNDMNLEMARRILHKKLGQLSERLAAHGATMTLDAAAQEFLLNQGFNAQYGAREMDRAIAQYLTPLLTDALLFGKLSKGGHATVAYNGNGLEIK